MPPKAASRYQFTTAIQDPLSRFFLTDRERFGFQQFADNRQHFVVDGDSLWTIASRYFRPLKRPALLWWIIADFQPEPIHDPTVALTVGTTLIIPSLRTVKENIFSVRRIGE